MWIMFSELYLNYFSLSPSLKSSLWNRPVIYHVLNLPSWHTATLDQWLDLGCVGTIVVGHIGFYVGSHIANVGSH